MAAPVRRSLCRPPRRQGASHRPLASGPGRGRDRREGRSGRLARPLRQVPTAIARSLTGADIERRIDRLYGLPREEFTAARNKLAREASSAGRRDQAERIRRLRKPTAAADLVNQLARGRPQQVEALLRAGDRLRTAHERVLAGERPETLRKAAAEERARLDELVGSLGSGKAPAAGVLEQVRETLRAAPLDDELRKRIAAGRLTEPYEATGLEAMLRPARDPQRPRRGGKPKDAGAASREQAKVVREELRAARRASAAAKARARKARDRLAAAERELASVEAAVSQRERELADASRSLDAAEQARRRLESRLARLSETAR